MDAAATKRYRQHIHIKLLEAKTEGRDGWTRLEHIIEWNPQVPAMLTRGAIQDLVRAGLVQQSDQRPGLYRARGHKPTTAPKEDTVTETPSTPCKRRHEEPAAAAAYRAQSIRKEALARAIEYHEGEGLSAGQIVASAKVFEGYIASHEEVASVSLEEAQELHKLIGTSLLQVRNRDATSIDPDDLERALEIASVIVSDIEGAE